MTGNHLARVEETGAVQIQGDQLALLKRTIAKDATDDEFALFVAQCNRTQLDPFAKQIWFVKRKGQMTVQTGIDGYRLIAERSDRYAGQDGPWWCGGDGVWREVWLENVHPSAARVVAKKALPGGQIATFPAIAIWDEYAPDLSKPDAFMWNKMPALMIGKCAEALALRKAFPHELSGLYVKEEMDQADFRPVHAAVRELPRQPNPDDIVSPEWVTWFAIACKEICPEGIDQDDFRHAVVYSGTSGRTESSKQVWEGDRSLIRTLLTAAKEGRAEVAGRVDGPPGLQLYLRGKEET